MPQADRHSSTTYSGKSDPKKLQCAEMVSTRMEPRYLPGERLYISFDAPPAIGDFVFVVLKSEGRAQPHSVVRRLVDRSQTKLTLEQFNPPAVQDVELDEVLGMHPIQYFEIAEKRAKQCGDSIAAR